MEQVPDQAQVTQEDEPEISIIEATSADAPALAVFLEDNWMVSYVNEIYGLTPEDILSLKFTDPEQIEKRAEELENPEVRCWLAKRDGIIVGSTLVEKGEESNLIRSVYVDPEFRNLGLGKKLTQTAMEWLGRDKKIVLDVFTANTDAMSFYEQFGFTTGDNQATKAPFGTGKTIDEIEMFLDPEEKAQS